MSNWHDTLIKLTNLHLTVKLIMPEVMRKDEKEVTSKARNVTLNF